MINRGLHQIQNYVSIKEAWVLILGFFTFLPAVLSVLSFFLVSDRRGRMRGVGAKVGSACEEMKVVNVSLEFWCRITG